jgi:uncharacterized protein YkwD
MQGGMKHRFLLPLLIAAFCLFGVGAPAAQAAATPQWQLICMINNTRAAHGLGRLYFADGLRNVAQTHSRDMLDRRYFSHTSPTGSTLYYRIAHSGFTRYGAWWAGETLAWGTGSYATPYATLRMWLNSPTHRAVLLSSRYNWIGIGRTVGTFQGHTGAVVWTANFGHR